MSLTYVTFSIYNLNFSIYEEDGQIWIIIIYILKKREELR